MIEYVDLKRNFVVIDRETEPELSIGRVWGARYGGWLEWSALLDHDRVVLLAEAASGKSEEFRHTADGLRSGGNAAFYATIEQLTESGLSLGPDLQPLLNAWKAGSEHGWFFLDSVDEARLNQKKFETALRKLASELGPALARARILVSCRVSDWKGKSDRQTLLDILPLTKPTRLPPVAIDPDNALLDPIFESKDTDKPKVEEKSEEKPDVLVVQLIPLTDEQRRALAQASGITDVDPFLKAIERQGLDVLAERPGDILELAEYWINHKSFGTLTAMTDAAVTTKLNELDRYRPDNTQLTPAQAREGAERLAAGMTLAKTFTLISSGQEVDPSLATGALDPTDLLDDWNIAQCNALARRGIFAPSTYGRLRFHHRSTQEYLTSRWFDRLLQNGCPRFEVFSVLFAERYGVETVVPSLRSAAAWMAQHHPDIRDEIIRREPLVLVTHGDPAALSIDAKTRVLLELARRHAAGEIADDSMDRRALALFSAPELGDAVRKAWRINKRPDFRADLIRLIREGGIKDCIDLAEITACDDSAGDYPRITAAEALVACAAEASLKRVAAKLMRQPSKAGPRLAAGFAKILFPKYLSVKQLLVLNDKSRPPSKHSTEGFADDIDTLWESCSPADQAELMSGLTDTCLQKPFVNDYQRVSRRHAALARHLGPIAYTAVSQLGTAEPSDPLVKLLSVVERAERPHRLDGDGPQLNKLVRAHPQLNRALFWFDAQEVRQNTSHPVEAVWQIHFGGAPLWEITAADLPWLRDDLKSLPSLDDRRVALSALAELLKSDLKTEATALRKLIGKNPVLRKELNIYLRPPAVRASTRRHLASEEKRKLELEAQRVKDKEAWRIFRDELLADPSQLSDPAKVSTNAGLARLRNLSKWLSHKTGEKNSAMHEWRHLDAAFSIEIATAYYEGMKVLWRVTEPEAPKHTPGGPTTTKYSTVYAYAAIGMEAAENPRFAETLSDNEARRATLHACISEQGYPEWIETIVAARPTIAVPIVNDTFAREWNTPQNGVAYFLHRFAQTGVPIQPELRKSVFDIVVSAEPKNMYTVDRLLEIVRNLGIDPVQRAALKDMAATRFKLHQHKNPEWAARYMALLFWIDSAVAADALTRWLKSVKHPKRSALALTVLALLFGSHHPLAAGSLANVPVDVLKQLVLFAYQEIKPEDDNVHEGSYSPDLRDDAEGARGSILKALVETDGASAHRAMLWLSSHRRMKARRIRFRELARRMAERDADLFAWSPRDAVKFERNHTAAVKTGWQLYRITQAVVREIVWGFENGDASSRAVLETASDENAVQHWLADQMKQRANGRFHATREPEVAEGNMPDVLVSAVGAAVEVAIEAKHGDKSWSTNALEDSLRNQLAEDYLRPTNRRHGIFVITNHSKRGWSHPTTKKRLNFDEMIAYLNNVAEALTRNTVGEIEVVVIGVDATPKPRRRSTTDKRQNAKAKKTATKRAGNKRRVKKAGKRR